ncbi:MAG: ABC transporter substrate-binding protein [Cytophagales bacterium]|nr:ABC transporter substrate-binding protein [Bernardetiaceae bacterium]MDW8206083.1 ABC transporter substrate-binding protein [Cytophagales bacterium]
MSKLLRCLLTGYGWCLLSSLYAQSLQEFTNSFQLGKRLVDEKKYVEAKHVLANVLKDVPQNPYYKYGTYFYALASYYTGEYARCQEIALQLLNRYPTWEQADEIRLLAALSALETDDLNNANAIGNLLKNNQTKQIFENAKLARQQKATVNASPSKTSITPLDNKRRYHVAVFLPFMLSETDPSKPSRRYQFVYDMYEGMQLAQEDLAEEGIDIQLYPFDTERSNVAIRRQLDAQSGVDLLIGPLYSNNIEPLAAYASQHRISLVNPFGTTTEPAKHDPTIWVEPNAAALAQQAALFAAEFFPGKTAIIYYGNTPEDSVMAHYYKQAHERNNGRVYLMRTLTPKMNFQRIIGELDGAPRNDSTHLFICARQPAIAISLVSAILSTKRVLPAITTQEWLNYDLISYDQLQKARVHFLIPDFVRETPAKTRFDKLIVERTNMVPSKFAYIGYETVYFFGKMLRRYGKELQSYLSQESAVSGKMMPGFDFSNGKENMRTAICTFNNGVLQQIFPN